MTCRQLVLRCLHLLTVEWAEDLLQQKLRFLLPLAYNIASNKNAAGMELVRRQLMLVGGGNSMSAAASLGNISV